MTDETTTPLDKTTETALPAEGEKQQGPAAGEEAYIREALARLKAANADLYRNLETADTLDKAREKAFGYLETRERSLFGLGDHHHPLENATIRECIFALKSIFGPINEKYTGLSSLDILWKHVRGAGGELPEKTSPGFFEEFIHLFLGTMGKAHIYADEEAGKKKGPQFLRMHGREAAENRTRVLDEIGRTLTEKTARYPSGLEQKVLEKRKANRERVLAYFKGTEEDWNDYRWHLDHVIKTSKPVADLIELTPAQTRAIDKAVENRIPFGITPFYLSLMDPEIEDRDDHAVRAQVIPPPDYVDKMAAHKQDRSTHFDFMGEHDTSPVGLVTRRYPRIAILKPFNTCSQICVYCQRNWEIEECMAPDALASDEVLDKALDWLDRHPAVGEVLVTGGDPCVMHDEDFARVIDALASKDQIYRIRIGTRTPVVLPFRWTDDLVDILARNHAPGRREVCVVTHFSHSYEITPEALEAVRKIRRAGMGVYNQQVFTLENSRRFETVKLRLDLRSIGVDPYYTFNMKGKEETHDYMVPISRLLQERKEEARLLPGIDRTDEPVFNVPRLGKNHLRALQDHRVVMIRSDGRRIYEFHPWEKNITLVSPYFYTDVSIHEYLERLKARGEDPEEYKSLWYYF